MKRILAIDYGDVRTGLAISDELLITAQPLETFVGRGDDINLSKYIISRVNEYHVKKILVGNPVNMDGSYGKRMEVTENFVGVLKKCLSDEDMLGSIEIVMWDERLTTAIANRTMTEMGIKRSKRKGIVDQIAAVEILQNYLDYIR